MVIVGQVCTVRKCRERERERERELLKENVGGRKKIQETVK